MIIFRLKSFSDKKKHKKTEKYRKLSDHEIKDMSKGQRLRALELEHTRATRNADAYRGGYSKVGAILGAAGGAGLGYKTGAMGAATGAVLGGVLGHEAGSMYGTKKANQAGHNPDHRVARLAKRIDRVARKNGQDDIYEHEALSRGYLKGIKEDTDFLKSMAALQM